MLDPGNVFRIHSHPLCLSLLLSQCDNGIMHIDNRPHTREGSEKETEREGREGRRERDGE